MGVIWFLRPVPDPFLTLLTQLASVARQPVPGGCNGSGRGDGGLPGHQKNTLDIFHSDVFSVSYAVFYWLQRQKTQGEADEQARWWKKVE